MQAIAGVDGQGTKVAVDVVAVTLPQGAVDFQSPCEQIQLSVDNARHLLIAVIGAEETLLLDRRTDIDR